MSGGINLIYSGKPEDFHWAGFGSGSGTNLGACAKVVKPSLIFSDRPKAKLFFLEELMGVTTEVIDGYKKCGSWKACKGDSKLKAAYERRSIEYNEEIVEELQRHEEIQQAPFDLIVLAGYMRLVKQPLLDAYPDKIINVHPSSLPVDLSLREKRRFIGEDAVYDAIKEGQTRTCSSVIMVDSLEDHGEILTQGPNLLVWNEFLYGTVSQREEWFREYADVHQTLQKVRSDFPALTTALKMISQGEIALGSKKRYYDEWRRVYVNGEPMPYSGLKVRLP